MTEYYYSKNPHVKHRIRHWDFELRGHQLRFVTDNGVFSKATVDYGSRALISAVSLANLPKGPVLDLGCGYGPIGLSLAKATPERQFVLTDVNQLALKLARRNAHLNRVANVTVLSSDVYHQLQGRKFASIVTNPPIRAGKKVVLAILTGAIRHLLLNGRLYTVIRKKQGEPSAKKALQRVFGNCRIVTRDKGYYVLVSNYQGGDHRESSH